MLNFASFYEVEEFLKEREAELHYNEADLEHDIKVINKLMVK